MSEAKIEADPSEVGLDAERLARVDSHFRRYVDDGRLPGWSIAVARKGRIAHLSHYGVLDLEDRRPVGDDSRWRIYSMTKPITSVAALMLWEQGALELTDPVSRYIPEFADQRVYRSGSALNPGTDAAAGPMRIWHLLTHTSGLTYGFHHAHPVDEMYRSAGYEFGAPRGVDLAGACAVWGGLPLLFEPGTEWNYSVATDVLGRVVEVASGTTLDRFFAERILGPLGMDETGFRVDADDQRLATLYAVRPGGELVRNGALGDSITREPEYLSGGGGLASTLGDYHRFAQMLARGGELDGVRLLGPRTLAHATRNHLPGGADLDTFGRPIFAESAFTGVGFGLGFSVVIDGPASHQLASEGTFAWGGLASTAFWVDPAEDLTVLFMTQVMPSSAYPIRAQLQTLVYQSIVDQD
ncbi:serine hydrolase domain-containing protein [Pseudonocardia endophytica]|uniref:CubicO group peptidase (Beta-lactamase class C family) n=1 Tax=Pseudonocardia endophytica TaxID=401976 RepID=A0A4R1HSB8_PSEEN|nr:serine hydrolase domain-containing protein [Pseudonocardia endophytica]TCK20272.1 CubicO group peptidase (beta-lactamase class C family) [Pseudonocardia endophytica]